MLDDIIINLKTRVIKLAIKEYYLYRFLDKNNKVIYIGRTNNINRRILREHFTNNTHLIAECYSETEKVEFVKLQNESEQVVYEASLINFEKPKYNKQFNDNGNIKIEIPDFEWTEFEWEFAGQKELMKMMKSDKIQLEDSLASVVSKISNAQPNRFVSTGYRLIDKMVVLYPEATMLIAETGSLYGYKYTLNIVINNAINSKKVLYLNLKNSAESITYQILSLNSNVDLTKIQSGSTEELTKEEWGRIVSSASLLKDGMISFINHSEEKYDLEFINKKAKADSYDLIIIDDLNSVTADNNYDSDKMNIIMQRIKKLALEIRTPIISLYSFDKKKFTDEERKKCTIHDLSYNSLKNFNDIIQFVHAIPFYEYDKSEETKDFEFITSTKIEVITAKNSLGMTGAVELCYDNGRFINFEKGEN